MNQNVQDFLNLQINKEINNAYVYKYFSAVCSNFSLHGFEKFYNSQAKDELSHMEKIFQHMLDRGVIPVFHSVRNIIPIDFGTTPFSEKLKEILQFSLFLEQETTESLERVFSGLIVARDIQSEKIIRELLDEQIEEVKIFSDILSRMRFGNILQIDVELNK